MENSHISQYLNNLHHLYQSLLSLEKLKRKKILAKDVEKIQDISKQQEEISFEVSILEDKIMNIFTSVGLPKDKMNISTFLEKSQISQKEKNDIMQLKKEIETLVSTLKDEVKRNETMLQDSILFFKELIKYISSEDDPIYSIKENNLINQNQKNNHTKPVFLNTLS